MPSIRSVTVTPFDAPLKRPFVTALGRKTSSPNVGVFVKLSDGAEGYGEASSSLALKHVSQAALTKALKELGVWARGRDAEDPGALADHAWERLPALGPAAAAFESAVTAAACASRGVSLRTWFGGGEPRLETDITISAWDVATTTEAVREARREGFRIYKVKVGGRFEDDLERVRAVHLACPGARVLLDGNQGLTPRGALMLVEACLKFVRVDLLEQPLPKDQFDKMPALARSCPVPIALDESVATPEDAVRAVDRRACGAINIKLAKSGLRRALRIAAVARTAGLKLMLGWMAETAAGLDSSVALAMGTGYFQFADLDSDHLLKSGGRKASFVRRGPLLLARD